MRRVSYFSNLMLLVDSLLHVKNSPTGRMGMIRTFECPKLPSRCRVGGAGRIFFATDPLGRDE